MDLTGDADRPPLTCSVPQALFHAGAEAAGAVLIALEERRRSGLGQHIDVSAQTAMMASNQSAVLSSGWNATPMTRTGGGVSVGPYRVRFIYACKDGFMNLTFLFGEPIGHATQRFFDWMDEEGFSNDALRAEDWVAYGGKIMRGETPVEAHEAVLEAIETFTRTRTKAELLAAAFERQLFIVPLNDCADLVASPHLAERAFWREIDHPAYGRPVLHPGPFARLSATPLQCDRPAPLLGELKTVAQRRVPPRAVPGPKDGSPPPSGGPFEQPEPPRRPPLAELKVLDFSWVYAGPALTRTLADYGASVVKVESSQRHDALRASGPFFGDRPGPNRSANFANVNLGKSSIGLDLKQEAGRELALRLVDWADVVVENFSPGAIAKLGLGWAGRPCGRASPDSSCSRAHSQGRPAPIACSPVTGPWGRPSPDSGSSRGGRIDTPAHPTSPTPITSPPALVSRRSLRPTIMLDAREKDSTSISRRPRLPCISSVPHSSTTPPTAVSPSLAATPIPTTHPPASIPFKGTTAGSHWPHPMTRPSNALPGSLPRTG
jgi:crotonobetainyl-CoA:carnitine CoA-transferase CaiB-like acyl-CoA transferase